MKISNKAKEDFNLYLKNRKVFTFSGTLNKRHEAFKGNHSALEAFYSIDTYGKNIGTKHPNILDAILQTKASLNFMIKQWAEGRADGTLPLIDFSKDYAIEKGKVTKEEVEGHSILEWVNREAVYFRDVVEMYNLPKWVVIAVEHQKKHFLPDELKQYA